MSIGLVCGIGVYSCELVYGRRSKRFVTYYTTPTLDLIFSILINRTSLFIQKKNRTSFDKKNKWLYISVDFLIMQNGVIN